jgi:hypothetical protein
VRFRPQFLSRFGALVPASVLCVATGSVWDPDLPNAAHMSFGAAFAVILYPTFRWIVVSGVSATDECITVHGAWWSRRITRHDLVLVRERDGIPFLHWRTETGRSRRTPMFAFTTVPGDPSWFAGYNARVVQRIDTWIDRGDPVDSASR